MKKAIALILCGLVAACSQTTAQTQDAVPPKSTAVASAKHTKTAQASYQRCQEAMQKARAGQANAAMLGGALSMVGGLAGFGGRGGAIAAQAVSAGGSIMQAKAQNDANAAMTEECY